MKSNSVHCTSAEELDTQREERNWQKSCKNGGQSVEKSKTKQQHHITTYADIFEPWREEQGRWTLTALPQELDLRCKLLLRSRLRSNRSEVAEPPSEPLIFFANNRRVVQQCACHFCGEVRGLRDTCGARCTCSRQSR